jgi:dipeptidyl-peptidase 4
MKNIKKLVVLLLLSSFSIVAQEKITLEEIWGGAFRTKGMDELNAMKTTNQYTVLNFDRASRSSQIDLYDFATLEKVSTLLSSKDFSQLQGIDSYTFNKKENQILIALNKNCRL